jgi:hypothetical protein
VTAIPGAGFGALIEALAGRDDITIGQGRGFGAGTLQVDGRIFAIGRAESVVLKLPATRVAELIAAGDGVPFDSGKGRPMKEWVTVSSQPSERLVELALEAVAFVRSG